MSIRILVTGSSGFIGTHLSKTLIDRGYAVYGLDIQEPDSPVNDFQFVQCDILNASLLGQVLLDCHPQAVIHLAARTDLDGKNVSDYATNVEGVQNLLKAVADTRSVQRTIYTSSQLVCRVGYVPQDEGEYCPNTLYGESKVLTENIVRQYDGGGVEWCLVRPTTVWGPGMNPHYQRFFRMIQTGHYFHVGNRPLYKSYGYVGNTVYQYLKILEARQDIIHRKVFYLADYEPLSLRAWVNALQQEMDASPVPTVPESLARMLAVTGDILNWAGARSFPLNSFRLKNILTEYQFDLSSTKTVCGELPYTVEEGVKETVAWLRAEIA